MISETCACGGSFQAERSDELKLWEAWLARHKCRERTEFTGSIDAALGQSDNLELDEMRLVGFSRNYEDE
jgi:hypothetical protein